MKKKEEIKLACTVVQQVEEICDKHGNKPGELINVLHECQALHGYLPEEMQRIIARKLGVPASKVYGVVTFYSFFAVRSVCWKRSSASSTLRWARRLPTANSRSTACAAWAPAVLLL